MNQYNYDEQRGFIVTHAPSKTLDDVKRVIASGRPQKGIDAAIAAYIPTLDPTQPIIDAWYEQHLLVDSLDADEVVTRTYRDENGDEQTETLDNPYTVALNARTDLEDANTWLKGYRGLLSVPVRPEFTMTVEGFKVDNPQLFTTYLKEKGADVGGHVISLNESNQNGLAAVITGINLAATYAQDPFPINFKAETLEGSVTIPFEDAASFSLFALQFMGARQTFF